MDRHPICGKMDTQKQLNVPLDLPLLRAPPARLRALLEREELGQEVINRPNVDWQEQIHRGILRGLRNISETP